MGLVYVEAIVTGPTGKSEAVEFLIDSGAKYSLLPDGVWQRLEVECQRRLVFVLADGTKVERRVGEARFAFEGTAAWSPVILGEPGDEALLGVVTLETLALVLDPFNRTLHPARMMLA